MNLDPVAFPIDVEYLVDVIATPASAGVVQRRRKFPGAVPRIFTLTYEIPLATEVATLVAEVETARGAAVPVSATIPGYGTISARFVDDGITYQVLKGPYRRMTIRMREDPHG